MVHNEMSYPKYSFIVPVYNSENFLDTCVNSILRQTYGDFEIILVDDGSQDRSGNLCDEISSRDKRVVAIHKQNGGASSARNCGLKLARGKYVSFLDSDDYWDDAEGLAKINTLVNDQTDLVFFASKDYDEKTGTMKNDRYDYPEFLNDFSPLDCLSYLVQHGMLNMHSSKRVYRRAFLLDNNLFFTEGIRSEDVELGLRVADHLPQCKFLNEKLYVYRHHSGSVTQTIGQKHLEEYKWIIEQYAVYSFCNEQVKELLLSYVAYQYALLLAYIHYVSPEKKISMLKDLKRYTYLFKYQKYPRTKTIALAYRFLGYYPLGMILGYYLARQFR